MLKKIIEEKHKQASAPADAFSGANWHPELSFKDAVYTSCG